MTDVHFRGRWKEPITPPPPMVKPWKLIIDNVQAFGVCWYADYFFCPRASWEPDPEPEHPGELMVRPLDPVKKIKAEWWRRAGFRVLRRMVPK